MNDEIKVHVLAYPNRKNLMMRYRDPITRQQFARSTGTHRRREAERAAAKWESELREGRNQRTRRMAWSDFRAEYERAKANVHRSSTATKYAATFNAFQRHCCPERLAHLNTETVAHLAEQLRVPVERKGDDGQIELVQMSEATVAVHLRQLKAIAKWAKDRGWLPVVPVFDMPHRSKTGKMKGRPITLEEFERMLAATAGVVGDDAAESWKLFLRGLWASGLRISEAVALRWDHEPGGVSVDLDGQRSVLLFDGESQKSGKTEQVPLAPEAVELLEPIRKPRGVVFTLARRDGEPMARHLNKISKTISKIGAAANVVTDHATGRTASAHDLRRAFGARWSKRVMPATLKQLMRHASIETTMTYYVAESAKTVAAELWAAPLRGLGKHLGNTPDSRPATKPR